MVANLFTAFVWSYISIGYYYEKLTSNDEMIENMNFYVSKRDKMKEEINKRDALNLEKDKENKTLENEIEELKKTLEEKKH